VCLHSVRRQLTELRGGLLLAATTTSSELVFSKSAITVAAGVTSAVVAFAIAHNASRDGQRVANVTLTASPLAAKTARAGLAPAR